MVIDGTINRFVTSKLRQNWQNWHNNRHWEDKQRGMSRAITRPPAQRQELRRQREREYYQRPEVQRHRQSDATATKAAPGKVSLKESSSGLRRKFSKSNSLKEKVEPQERFKGLVKVQPGRQPQVQFNLQYNSLGKDSTSGQGSTAGSAASGKDQPSGPPPQAKVQRPAVKVESDSSLGARFNSTKKIPARAATSRKIGRRAGTTQKGKFFVSL